MKPFALLPALLCYFFLTTELSAQDEQKKTEPPTEWVDADTGHRVVRLSREPGSASLYFHQRSEERRVGKECRL